MSATFLKTKDRGKRGFTVIEAVFYMGLLVVITVIVVQAIIAIGGVYKKIKAARELESSGAIAMESLLQEIKNASNVSMSGSLFGSDPGFLTLVGKDESGNEYQVLFTVSSGKLMISKNGGAAVPLTSSAVYISRLAFSHLSSPSSEAVRVQLDISSASGAPKTERFYGFAVLRSSY